MRRERILIVDDEEAVRGTISSILEREGYLTTVAAGPEEALLRLQEGPSYELVLSDILMPGTDGLSLLQQVCYDHAGTPVVIVSAVQDVRVAIDAFRNGAIDYLTKPFTRDQLTSVVKRALEHGRMARQNAEHKLNLEDIVSARTARLRSTMEDLERSYDSTLEAMG